ncbi:MAG: type III secretion system export apparatus subunit SctV [Bdellovibrionota bacterium]
MNSFLTFLKKNSEFTVVAGVLMVLAMLIIPLPTELIDTLIVINISLSVTLLMVVIYIIDPLKLSSFPSILLLLALFRIGITISTTRLILLHADAGKVVETFGNFVAGGNLVVGFIVFLIITIINFIVITKGSERVAEVCARFSLDGLPGKQMSVDADLRANIITGEQAMAKRKHLELESRFHASMDGALKFVKGDNIASIIDIIINLIGGVTVGVFMHGFPVGQALSTFSILTIGDGLVQIIPALIVSVTAGLIVTRISDQDEKDPTNMGQAIVQQLLALPKALFGASAILALFAFVPGMPTEIFLAIFAILVTIASVISFIAKKEKKQKAQGSTTTAPKMLGEEAGDDESLPVLETWKLYPLMLNVAPGFKGTEYLEKIKTSLSLVQKNIKMDLGVEVPQIFMRYDENQAADTYQILVQEVPAAKGKITRNRILLLENEENMQLYGITEFEASETNIGDKVRGVWIEQSNIELCKEFNLVYLTVEEFLTKHLSFVIKQHISEFLGMQEVKNMLDKMTEFQDLIKELLRMLPLNKITEILQRLIGEDISIRNFKVILDAALEWAQREKDIILITEYVRGALGRYIAHKFSNGKNILPCILISSDLEDTIRDAIRHTATGSYLAIDPNVSLKIIEYMKEILEKYKAIHIKPVVLVTLDIRRYLRTVVEKELPYLHVLSFQELEGHAEFENLGIVDI